MSSKFDSISATQLTILWEMLSTHRSDLSPEEQAVIDLFIPKGDFAAASVPIRAALPIAGARPELMYALHRFLDAAASDGLVCGHICAADLYVKIFPVRHAAALAPTTPVPAEPVAWDVRNAEISYRGIFATEKEARAIADQHDEAGYSQAIVMPLVYPTPGQQTQNDAVAGAIAYQLTKRLVIDMPTARAAARAAVDAALKKV